MRTQRRPDAEELPLLRFVIIPLSVLLGLDAGPFGCAPADTEDAPVRSTSDPLDSDNGISANGLAANGLSTNGLSGNGLSTNGLSSNGLSTNGLSTNGLSSANFSSWFRSGDNSANSRAYAAQIMKYVVRCACPKSETRTFIDGGVTYTWVGNLGLAPSWCGTSGTGARITVAEQEWISACLLAHTNVLSNPLAPDPNLSVPISLAAVNPEVNLPRSTEELVAMEGFPEVFFGNLFDPTDLSNAKGLYAGSLVSPNGGPSKHRTTWDAGRQCAFNGCPGNAAGIQYFGVGANHMTEVTLAGFLDELGYDGQIRCKTNADCAGTNDGVTPLCKSVLDNGRYRTWCRPLGARCQLTAALMSTREPIYPISCLDPSGRSWSRVVAVYPSQGKETESGAMTGPVTIVSGASTDPTVVAPSNASFVSNLGGGGATRVSFNGRYVYDATGYPSSDRYRVRVRYQGSGVLAIDVITLGYSGYASKQLSNVSYGNKTLSCPAGQWCWAEWSGVYISGDPTGFPNVPSSNSPGFFVYDAVVRGVAGQAAPSADAVNLTAGP